jgi:hypothetical protein
MPDALIRRTSQAANILLALALLTALIHFRASAVFFVAGCFLHAVASLPAFFRALRPTIAESDSVPVPALQ